MVWVVNGARRKRDYPRFIKGKYRFNATNKKGIFSTDSPEKYFPSDWLTSSVPVIFDFRSVESRDCFKDERNQLYCLFPERIGNLSLFAEISHRAFINSVTNGNWTERARGFMNEIVQANDKTQRHIIKRKELLKSIISEMPTRRVNRYTKRRRRF